MLTKRHPDKILRILIFLSKYIGIDESLPNWLQILLCFLQTVFFVTATVPVILYTIRKAPDITSKSDAITPGLGTTFLTLQYLCIFYRRREYAEMLKALQSEWDKYVTNNIFSNKFLILAEDKCRTISIAYLIFTSLGIFGIAFSPIVIILFELIRGQPLDEIPFPMKVEVLYDTSSALSFSLTYIYFVFCITKISFAKSAVDIWFVTMAIHVAAHFKILNEEVRQIACKKMYQQKKRYYYYDRYCGRRRYISENLATGVLKRCVKRHNVLIGYVKKMEIIFSYQAMIQFGSSALMICLLFYQIALNKNDFTKLVSFSGFLSVVIGQLFMFAWAGQILLNESEAIADAAYSCPWYLYSSSFKKSLVLIIQRAQKPLGITASKFYIISIEGFSKIISAAVSYFTLLQSVD